MQPAVSLVFFLVLAFHVIFMLVTQQTIWKGIMVIHKDDCPFLDWFHFWCALVPAVIIAAYCWRDWLKLLT